MSYVLPWVLTLLLLAAIAIPASAAPNARDDLWVTNGIVYSSVLYGNNSGATTGAAVGLDTVSGLLDTSFPKVVGTVNVIVADGTDAWYLGGNFTSVGGIARNNIARINADKTLDADWDPNANGEIHTMLLVGTTLVVGGDFTQIGGVTRNHLAALITTLDSGFVTAWHPDADDNVLSMALFGTTLYFGGEFTQVGGLNRNYIAAVDANIDECGNTVITEWDPDANNSVRSMVSSADGRTLYVGGDFTSVGNKSRNKIASLETVAQSAGTLMMTPRSSPGDTLNVKVTDSQLNTNTGTVQTVTVSIVNRATGEIETITLTETANDSCIFTGTVATVSGAAGVNNDGTMNTQAGNTLIATYNDAINSDGVAESVTAINSVVASTDEATVWNPNADGNVHTLLLSGNTLYVGGDFISIGGKNRNRIAALNTLIDINNATEWVPNANAAVRTMLLDSTILYVGGDFTVIGGKNRDYIAALETNVNANNATTWQPGLDGPVYGMARAATTVYAGGAFNSVVDDSRLYIGGDFTYVGPNNGSGVGIDIASVQAGSAFPIVNGPVYAAASDGANGWYIGGSFSDVGGVTRNNIAHIELSGSDYIVDADWDPNVNNTVLTLLLNGSTLYAGGNFTSVDGQARNNIAALDITTVASPYVTAWNPNANGPVSALELSGGTLYVGGTFTTIGGQTRNNIAAIATADGSADATWNPNANGAITTLVLSGGILYAGGNFTSVDGQARNNIAALDITAVASPYVTAWNPNANGPVSALESSGGTLYVGGTFTMIGGQTRNNIAAIATADGSADAWDPNINNSVRTMLLSGATIYLGGDFTSIGGIARKHIAVVNTVTGLPTSWQINAGNSVYTLSLSFDNTMMYAGGTFTSIGGVIRNRIAALDLVNGDATAWDPSANNVVRTMTMSTDNTRLFVGGDFTVIGGNARNRIAALDRVSGSAASWHPDANGAVSVMMLDDNDVTLYVGGDFTSIGGIVRNHIASLNTNATANAQIVNPWNPDATNGAIRTMALFGTTLYVGGEFTASGTIGGQNRNHIAALRTTNNTATAWNPNANSNVNALSLSTDGQLLYLGGEFTAFAGGNVIRNHIAGLDTTTVVVADMLTDWNPDADGVVRALSLSRDESTLYIGGDFTTLDGGAQIRDRIAAVSTDDGSPVSWWDSGADAPVYSITASDDSGVLYTGGAYTQIDGSERSYFAALEISPPVTRAFPVAGAYSVIGGVTLICDDQFGSDCAVTYYTTDGSTPTTSSASYSTPIAINADTTIKFFSIDNVGNQETVQTAAYMIETDAPVTTATPPGGSLGIANNRITLTCDDADGGGCASIYYTLDGTDPTTSSTVYVDPITLADDTTLKYFAVDNAGNIETPVKTEVYIVDISVPRTTASPATRVFDSSKLSITLSCDDTPVEEEEPGVGDIPEGAVDPNTGDFPDPNDFNNPDPGDFNATTSVIFITSIIINAGSGCAATYYTTDGTTPTTASTLYTAPFNISDNTIIKYFSVDSVGNIEGVKRDSYISHKSSIGMFGPFAIWLCLVGIGIRFYFQRQPCH